MSIPNQDILIESDAETQDFYTIWEPGSAIGTGRTKEAALDDLKEAVHFYIDTMVELKLRETDDDATMQGGGAK